MNFPELLQYTRLGVVDRRRVVTVQEHMYPIVDNILYAIPREAVPHKIIIILMI